MQVLLSTMNEKYQIADKLSSMELRYAFIRQKLEAGVDMYSLCTYLGQNKRPDVIVNPAVKIGKGVILSSASIVEHGAIIHDYSHVEAGTIIRKGMIIPAGMRVNNLNLNELNSAQNAG